VNGPSLKTETTHPSPERDSAQGARHRGTKNRALLSICGVLVIGTIASACGSKTATPTTTTTKPAAAGGGTTANVAVAVSTANNAKLGTILVNGKGFTLYRFTKDSMNTATCTGGCAKVWPPLMASGSGLPAAGTGVTGLGTIAVAGGRQVTYKGMPLYTYVGDSSPGQTNGQGIDGDWFAVTTKSSAATTTTAPAGGTTTTTAGGGGGVGF
jgi:predicted lipoprotein with Yx(FWY)xxD motif